MNRSWIRLVLPTLLLVGGLAYCWQSRHPGTVAAPASSGSGSGSAAAPIVSAPPGEYSALLDGLKVGDTIGEWKVERIFATAGPNQSPQLTIDFERKGSGMTVWVARKEVAYSPPITTDKYGISYGHLRQFGEPIPPSSAENMGAQIADRVRRAENKAPVPTGL